MDQKLDKRLHILNGDATIPEFRKSGIKGDLVIWREALCDGPVSDPIRENLFWEKRATYIQEGLGGENYADKMLTELDKLRDLSSYNEVVLWFEYDLFCQVNMLACLSFIDHEQVSLICLGNELDGQLRGLGEISAGHFQMLFKGRSFLSKEDISYARAAWQAYVHPTPEKLRTLTPSSTFKHLKPAIEAHLTRLPQKNGLNDLEVKMLDGIREGVNDERMLVGTMLRKQGYFGLGDMQYFYYLNQIRPLLHEDKLEVNESGQRIIQGLAVFPQPNQYIGGVFRPDYYQKEWGQNSAG